MNIDQIKTAAGIKENAQQFNIEHYNYTVDFHSDKNQYFQLLKYRAEDIADMYLTNWFENREEKINEILNCFDGCGNVTDDSKFELTATAFNDLYKWTMMPVIRAMEKSKNDGKVYVTFGIDLRSDKAKNTMNADGFKEKLFNNLTAMAARKFDEPAFRNCLTGDARKGLIDDDTIQSICNNSDGTGRKLAQVVHKNGDKNIYETDDNVHIYLYETTKEKEWVVEATGPWHKVTWLETSMMQCVYQTMLMHELETKRKSYSTWLGEALLRCAKSVAFTHLINANGKVSTPALFTGRRTGGLLFILLQNLFFADHFKQFIKPASLESPEVSAPVDNSLYNTLIGPTRDFKCLGTSSCESNYILTKKFDLPCLNPAGTHAHELSMVSSVLYPQLDMKKHNFPYTQVLGHYLYYKLSWRGGPVPMLPDTLGTCAFINAAKYAICKNKNKPAVFFDVITFARQDSGTLTTFKEYLKKSENLMFKKSKMASEIDNTETLFEAATSDYKTFGAGGFFGDSEKVWSEKTGEDFSMAIKAVRVMYKNINDSKSEENVNTVSTELSPYVTPGKTLNDFIIGYPIKLGDIKTPYSEIKTDKAYAVGDKISIDKNLDDIKKNEIVTRAVEVRKNNIKFLMDSTVDNDFVELNLEQICGELGININPIQPQTAGRRQRRYSVRNQKRRTRKAIPKKLNPSQRKKRTRAQKARRTHKK